MAIYLSCLGTAVASEAQYIIRPSRSQGYCCDQCSTNADSMNNSLTLSQFVNNSIDYLANDTALILSPGNYRFDSELVVENVHSFSMFAWPSLSSKAVIVCSHNARFEFSNVSIVTVSGLEFVGCFNNNVLSVDHFQLENSQFFGNGQTIVNSTVLTIEESSANLDKVAFTSIAKQPSMLPENCACTATVSTMCTHRVIGILLRTSSIKITQSWFEGNDVGVGGVIYGEVSSDITIINTTFVNNLNNITNNVHYYCRDYCNITEIPNGHTGGVVYASSYKSTVEIYDSQFANNVGVVISGDNCSMLITNTKFINNEYSGPYAIVFVHDVCLTISHSTFTNNMGNVLSAQYTNSSISYSQFVGNSAFTTLISMGVSRGKIGIDHCELIDNTENSILVDNTLRDALVYIDGDMITISLSKFMNNRAWRVVWIYYYTTAENLTNNVFVNNSATYEVLVDPHCRPGHGLGYSLGSHHCIQCSENWRQDLIGITVAAFIAGIALVVFMLALNMTVAVGTLNGILFYANVVAANAEIYFLPFTAPNFVTVFISWLNLDIGFDVCFFISDERILTIPVICKNLIRLSFPAYVIFLVIIVIVASECSSKFAKIIGKCNPVAVLATLILLSYAKIFNKILKLISLVYEQPAYGSRKFDVSRLGYLIDYGYEKSSKKLVALVFFLVIISILTFLLCIIYTILVFSWQWLLQYQDKVIFKWVRYQKLRHFLEPYHAPYTVKYRYWTGLLLFIRGFLNLISALNFSLDPRVDLVSIIFTVGGLILLKGVTAKRIYKNWPLDVMETAIYFNLVGFSALTWYNLDFGGNQVAVAYTSVVIIFILLLGVIIFHIFRYTRLYECPFVEVFKWTSSKLLERKPEQEPLLNNDPDMLDGYQIERAAVGDQKPTYSVVELPEPAENQDEKTY